MVWKLEDPQGNESGKIRHMVIPYTRGRGLDLGCGPWKVWPNAISIDNFDEWHGHGNWRPDITGDVTDLSTFADRSLNFVFSSHLLEHLQETEKILKEWWRVIRLDGYLVLYLPHADLYPRIGQKGSNPDHKHDFLPDDITKIMGRVGGFDLVVNQTRDKGREYSFLQVYKKIRGNERKRSWKDTETAKAGKKTALLIRYGGIGDMIQVAAIVRGLKQQGFHITMQTKPEGEAILRANPDIDAFWLQDQDQVPQADLREYWHACGQEFDKTINLSESVEGLLLALPDRRNFAMSKEARHLLMNRNYLEMQCAIAEVPYDPKDPGQGFHPFEFEERAAQALRNKMGNQPIFLIPLAGSSVHKVWPHHSELAVYILKFTDAGIVYTGDRDCALLEAGILQDLAKHFLKIEPADTEGMTVKHLAGKLNDFFGRVRIHLYSGRWTIRETLAFLPQADLLIGPETGIMNAAALLPMPKIVMLSHSTRENLTRDWIRTYSIEPTETPCYPCHRMHYDRSHCPEDATFGCSQCAADIKPGYVMDTIARVFSDARKLVEARNGLQDAGGGEGHGRIDPELVQQLAHPLEDDPRGSSGGDIPAPQDQGDAVFPGGLDNHQHGHDHPPD